MQCVTITKARIESNGKIILAYKWYILDEVAPVLKHSTRVSLMSVITLNLSAMQTTEFTTDIASLESQFDHYNDLLDRAIRKNVKFTITKIIYRKLKEISDRLKKIRGLWKI